MSWDGTVMGAPLAGLRMLCEASMSSGSFRTRFLAQRHVHGHLVTVKVGVERGTHQRVRTEMALPSISLGWKAWMPRRCSVGAR